VHGEGRTQAKKVRLFVAVELPPELRRALGSAVQGIDAPSARWVPIENLHVTLSFLGWTPPRLLPWIERQVEAVAVASAPFDTHVTGFGSFPEGRRRARVLWAALSDPDRRFAALAGALEAGFAAEFPAEGRAFTPHVTLARFDPPAPVPELPAGPVGAPWRVTAVTLQRSHLRGAGRRRYERVRTFTVGGDPSGT
jgi:2'-5' RNA ligase